MLCSHDMGIHVWAYCRSKTFYLITYQPTANDLNFTTPNNQLNFRGFVGHRHLVFYSNTSVCAVGYDFDYASGPYLCEGD